MHLDICLRQLRTLLDLILNFFLFLCAIDMIHDKAKTQFKIIHDPLI